MVRPDARYVLRRAGRNGNGGAEVELSTPPQLLCRWDVTASKERWQLTCRICGRRLVADTRFYAAACRGNDSIDPTRTVCLDLGDFLRVVRDPQCSRSRGVYECVLFGEATPFGEVEGVRACGKCRQFR